MKKIFSLLLVLSLLVSVSAALAEDMEVHIIGGPELENEPVHIDDLKMNTENEISGWGILTATDFEVTDEYSYYLKGWTSRTDTKKAGADADYVILYVDIINTQLVNVDFLSEVAVKAVYDGVYEYEGWYRQRNLNNTNLPKKKGINPADNFAIEPMYTGHYMFGCTLPNAVINGKKSLRLIITIDGNEITYNIRK